MTEETSQTVDRSALQADEVRLRRQLGIPDEAKQVIIFAESSHWDPNWLYTSEEYYERFVRCNLDQAIAGLLREPRRVYSVECVFFLRLYWERQPEQREAIRTLVNEGRLRLTSSGVTTADTLLPSAEAILRDLLFGQEWLRAQGMTQEPHLAYFTDSFGCSPALPTLLRAAGFDRTAITRIDGMYFAGCDYETSRGFPRPGSSAERLLHQERSLDFVWCDPSGAEVLCHWNAFNYGQGDLLAHRGLNRVYLFPVAVADRSERNVARHIRKFAAQLRPYSRTPYLFCPIGMDFVEPIPDLVALLDRFNLRHSPVVAASSEHQADADEPGVDGLEVDPGPEAGPELWAVNAGLDDYLALVDCHRSRLPLLELDPNPYWTGFYTSRPALKERCYDLVDRLLLAERLALRPESDASPEAIAGELQDAWWTAAVSNHHDFITGTSPDRVVDGEQQPWLEEASATASAAVSRLAPAARQPAARPASGDRVQWRYQEEILHVQTSHYTIEIGREAGGGILRLSSLPTGQLLLDGLSNDLISYRDSGGLWRMGHEFRGGTFREAARAGDRPVRLEVQERDGGLEVALDTELDGLPLRRLYRFQAASPLIRLRVEGRAADGRTVTVRFHTGLLAGRLAMDQPGGVVVRPPARIYEPTFWPLQHFLHLHDAEGGRGLALWLRRPGAVSYQPDGRLEVVALRNANRERAFGLLPIPATPATGHERASYAFDYALWFTSAGDWQENGVDRQARALSRSALDELAFPGGAPFSTQGTLAASPVTVDHPGVDVIAVKPASRGQGLIARLHTFTTPLPTVTLAAPGRIIQSAFLCDARERDLEPLELRDGLVHLPMPGAIATVRLLVHHCVLV